VFVSIVESGTEGSTVKNGIRPNLAHIPLRWMVRECFKANSGIIFDSRSLARLGMDPNSLYPLQERRAAIPIDPDHPSHYLQKKLVEPEDYDPFAVSDQRGTYEELLEETEEERDNRDALAPLYDSLDGGIGWWILEYFPIPYENECHNEDRHLIWRPWNRGRGREIPSPAPGQKIKVHRSVQTRLDARDAEGKKYVPFAINFDAKNVQWVG